MTQELKDKWVAALRSGKYKQNTLGFLRVGLPDYSDVPRYCCLGVLREITRPGCSQMLWSSGNFLSRAGCRNLGIAASLAKRLANMNDGVSGFCTHSFSEIADWIEENVEVTA